jgi:hypothetical protein
MNHRMTIGLEQNVLTVLCWSDVHAGTVALQIPADLYSTREYQLIARAASRHIDKYGVPPKDHLLDILEKDIRKSGGELILPIIQQMADLKDTLQIEFVLNKLEKFVSIRRMAKAIEAAASALDQEEPEKAESLLYEGIDAGKKFDAGEGTWLLDPEQSLKFLDTIEEDYFATGVPTLDQKGVRPMRGKLMVLLGAKKKGKSKFLVEIGRQGLAHHHKTLHISLENGEKLTAQHYLQCLTGMVTHEDEVQHAKGSYFKKSADGGFTSLTSENLVPEVMTADKRHQLADFLRSIRGKLLIKGFPSGSLTIGQYNAYLTKLERSGFVPDLVLIDYPMLFNIQTGDKYRQDLGGIFVKLRGIAEERNHALVTVTQTNRAGGDAKNVTAQHTGEDWSIACTADVLLTYSQTEEEYARGLARIYVDSSRITRGNFTAWISQCYATGQFCLDSVEMTKYSKEEMKATLDAA